MNLFFDARKIITDKNNEKQKVFDFNHIRDPKIKSFFEKTKLIINQIKSKQKSKLSTFCISNKKDGILNRRKKISKINLANDLETNTLIRNLCQNSKKKLSRKKNGYFDQKSNSKLNFTSNNKESEFVKDENLYENKFNNLFKIQNEVGIKNMKKLRKENNFENSNINRISNYGKSEEFATSFTTKVINENYKNEDSKTDLSFDLNKEINNYNYLLYKKEKEEWENQKIDDMDLIKKEFEKMNLKEIVGKYPNSFPTVLKIQSTSFENIDKLAKMESIYNKEKQEFYENYKRENKNKNVNFQFLIQYIFELNYYPLQKFKNIVISDFYSFLELFIENLEEKKNLNGPIFVWIYFLCNIQKCPLNDLEIVAWNHLIKILVLKKLTFSFFSKDIDFLITYLKLVFKNILWS